MSTPVSNVRWIEFGDHRRHQRGGDQRGEHVEVERACSPTTRSARPRARRPPHRHHWVAGSSRAPMTCSATTAATSAMMATDTVGRRTQEDLERQRRRVDPAQQDVVFSLDYACLFSDHPDYPAIAEVITQDPRCVRRWENAPEKYAGHVWTLLDRPAYRAPAFRALRQRLFPRLLPKLPPLAVSRALLDIPEEQHDLVRRSCRRGFSGPACATSPIC